MAKLPLSSRPVGPDFSAFDSVSGAREILESIHWSVAKSAKAAQVQRRFQKFFLPVQVDAHGGLVRLQKGKKPSYFLTNLVLQGGGTLGLAHIGFIAGLEAAGVRFAGLAGTSAGAIVATAIVCARGKKIETPVGANIHKIVAAMPMNSFVDGEPSIKKLITAVVSGKFDFDLDLIAGVYKSFSLLARKRGLNPGRAFEAWLETTFQGLSVNNNEELLRLLTAVRKKLGKLGATFSAGAARKGGLLSVISSATPSGIKLSFPEDLVCFDVRYSKQSPAMFVRASMAIPAFFEPAVFHADNIEWPKRVKAQFAGLLAAGQLYEFSNAGRISLVDGGLFSNLPLDSFKHMTNVPTIALSLVQWSSNKRHIFRASFKGLLDDVLRLADSVRLQRDREMARELKGPRLRVIELDASAFNWLDFYMNKQDKDKLFLLGLERARLFIREEFKT